MSLSAFLFGIAAGLFVLRRFGVFYKQCDVFDVARYVLIDVSFREPIQTNMKCSKISPFVCGNISTNSIAKKY